MPLQATSGAASYDAFGGGALAVAPLAEAIDFDGTNDFLSRGDLTGNTISRTFTFSAWIWADETDGGTIYRASGSGSSFFRIELLSTAVLRVSGTQSTGSNILVADFDFGTLSDVNRTFFNILISVDLSNTARRFIYINDIQITPSWTTYTNGLLQFSQPTQEISPSGQNYRGRLSNVFLDYTYRDLSVEANRRLFVTADLKPALGQAALNPIMYLPMSDPTQPGLNQGTGGNFTLTGTVARSGRGPNQYNAPYSTFDGANDYLFRSTKPTGIANSTTATVSLAFRPTGTLQNLLVATENSAGRQELFWLYVQGTSIIYLRCRNATNTGVLTAVIAPSQALVVGRNYQLVISLDLSDTSKRHVYLNGATAPTTWSLYNTASTIGFNNTTYWSVASRVTDLVVEGLSATQAGAVWFNTSYIDLSVAANLAKFVTGTGIDAKPVDLGATGELPTGTSPLIYLPMYGNNAGKNYGTGGDFTVNSGPYTGARGPNEFWGNVLAPANGGGSYSSNYLKRASSLVGVTSNKTLSASFFFRASAVGSVFVLFDSGHSSGASGFRISVNASNQIVLAFFNSSSIPILQATTTSASIAANTWYHVCFSVDMSNSANRSVYVNGTSITTTWSTYSNNDLPLADVINLMIDGLSSTLGNTNQTLMSEFYLNNSYVDFTQEANRLKFRDAFGNPVDLTQQIEDAAIPNPAIYMRFPPTAFGTNSGTGGDFTVNGTISDGGQL